MDVVALAQYDINYAVASLGTSTTADHIQLLFRVTNNVICCYDGDAQDAMPPGVRWKRRYRI